MTGEDDTRGHRAGHEGTLDPERRFAIVPERRPPLDADKIISLIGRQVGAVGETNEHLIANARPADLLEALAAASEPRVRQIICDICGFAGAQEALPALVAALDDPSAGVRSSAADAIGKLGASRSEADGELEAAGVALLRRLHAESDPGIRRAMAVGLSGVRYEPALPAMREAAEHDELMQRIVEHATDFMGVA